MTEERLYRVSTPPGKRAFVAGFASDGSKITLHAPILKRWIDRRSLATTLALLQRSRLTIERVQR